MFQNNYASAKINLVEFYLDFEQEKIENRARVPID